MIFSCAKAGASARPCRLFSPRCATRRCARKSAPCACRSAMAEFAGLSAMMLRLAAVVMFVLSGATDIAGAQLRGHGGPVRALAISPDGRQAVSGSFDTSVIRWSLAKNAAEEVLRLHDGAVDA